MYVGLVFLFSSGWDCLALTALDLDMLGTHPDYRRRGAGSMLVRWGCELADRDGLVAYVDASPEGAALYRKFGFEDRTEAAMRERGVTTMVREADGSKL